jgi:hypothetical protein
MTIPSMADMDLAELAFRDAWKNYEKNQRLELNNAGNGAFFARIIRTKRNKMVLVRPANVNIRPGYSFSVVVFPHPKHVDAFKFAAVGVNWYGPARDALGSIGSIKLNRATLKDWWLKTNETLGDARVATNEYYYVNYAQTHATTNNKDWPADEKLLKQYESWRLHALKESISVSRSAKVDLVIDARQLEAGGMRNVRFFLKQAEEACRQTRTRFVNAGAYFLVKSSEPMLAPRRRVQGVKRANLVHRAF